MIRIQTSYPPSVNHYWGRSGKRVYLTPKARAYCQEVGLALLQAGWKPMAGEVEVMVRLYPPDRRKRDTDNPLKAILDSLQRVGLLQDDQQVRRIVSERMLPREDKMGLAVIAVRPFEEIPW